MSPKIKLLILNLANFFNCWRNNLIIHGIFLNIVRKTNLCYYLFIHLLYICNFLCNIYVFFYHYSVEILEYGSFKRYGYNLFRMIISKEEKKNLFSL